MTSRRHYLISYDISDDRQRTQVYQLLRDNGDHVQYSVFFCQLDRRELADLYGRMQTMINHATDQILLLDLGPAHNPLDGAILTIGRPWRPEPPAFII